MELDDMDARAVLELFRIADHDQNRQLDRVELADFLRLMRLRAIKTVTDNFRVCWDSFCFDNYKFRCRHTIPIVTVLLPPTS